MTLAAAQAFDLATFWVMVRQVGPSAEANPLVATLFATLGLPAVVLAKVALIVLVGSLGVAAAGRTGNRAWAVAGGLPLALAIAFGLIGGITNTSTLLP
jgi:hypothetical protein